MKDEITKDKNNLNKRLMPWHKH